MQNIRNRDLMVVIKNPHVAPELLNAETAWLNTMLNTVESTGNLAHYCEVLNIARYRIEVKYEKVLKALTENRNTPFVFIFNKN